MTHNSIFISDVHIRTRWCKSEALYKFLSENKCDNLFLIGDIIDSWNIHQGHIDSHQVRVIEQILDHPNAKLIIGNHEHDLEMVRDILTGIKIYDSIEYQTLSGCNFLVTHGHQFDSYRIMNHISLYRRLYGIASLKGDHKVINLLSKYAYKILKQNLNQFKTKAIKTAVNNGFYGIITGHTHFPEIDHNFYNSGDWITHGSALVEDFTGKIELIQCL